MKLNYHEYAPQIIQQLNLKGSEPCGKCPNCDGEDRFWINNYNGELRHHCRKCEFVERNAALQSLGLVPEHERKLVPYHEQKRIPLLSAKLDGADVVIPLAHVQTGEVVGQQTIKPNGAKIFNKGLKKIGVGCFIGNETERLYVTEGYATGVAVHKATGEQVLFALDANTLPKTVKLIEHPNVVIAADNDQAGIKAAQASGKPWVTPENDGDDWWDVYNYSGLDAVRNALKVFPTTKDDTLSGYAFGSALDLSQREFTPIKWLIEEFLPIPNLVLVGGAPKSGKSWYVMGLAEAIASMGLRVVYIANEDNERRLKDRHAIISDFPSDKLIFISGLSSKKPLPKGNAAHGFIKAIKDRYPDLKCLIVDTVQAIRDTSQKQDYGYVEREFSELRKLAHDLEITIIAVHHTKKKTDFETEPLDMVLGSQAIVATVETILIMERVVGSRDVNLFITGKDVEQREDYRLCWTERGFSDPQDRTLAALGSTQRAILDHVKLHPRCTQAAICEALGKSKQQVNSAVTRLLEMELLKSAEGMRLICSLTH